jgi:hypothetical protein
MSATEAESPLPGSEPTEAEELPVAENAQEDAIEGPKRFLPLGIAVGLSALFLLLLPPLSRSGLWDPYELNIADLARRVALNVFGAKNLALTGAENSLPYQNDLGRPELPFTSIAIGFRLFGLHEWAGRLPLALWGLAGVAAIYGAVARLVDRRAGVHVALVTVTTPLYFVQARSMMGDIVAMSAVAMAFSGLTVAVFDRDEAGPTLSPARLAWAALGALGLVAGFYARGALLGVAVPAGGVALAWLAMLASGGARFDVLANALGGIGLATALGATFMAGSVLAQKDVPNLSPWVGAMVKTQPRYPTFDYYIAHIGHAMAPWSAFAPFALGRLFIAPPTRPGALYDREIGLRVAIVCAAAACFAAHGLLAPRTDLIAFTGPALLAAACGLAIRDYERGAHASIAVAVGTVVLLGVLHHDFHALPEKVYQVFAVPQASFPEAFKDRALFLWWIVLGGFAVAAFLSWVERDAKREPFAPRTYLSLFRTLSEAWDGLLSLAYFAAIAGASVAGLVVWFGTRQKWKIVSQLSMQIRDYVQNAWWIAAIVPVAIVFGGMFACDVFLWAFSRSRPLSVASITRGFEPFEELFRRLRHERDREERLTTLAVLFPLMALAAPGVITLSLLRQGTRLPIAIAVGVPSGVAVFLVLGLLGDVVRRRGAAVTAGGVIVGLVLSFSYYPALANQLSPKDVFESYQRLRHSTEQLGLLGVTGRTAAYYAGGQPTVFTAANEAFGWLVAPDSARRFLAVKGEELPPLNRMYRETARPRTNLPVVDDRSSQILLAASKLEAKEVNANPLDKIVLDRVPQPQHVVDANLEDKLLVLGFDLLDANNVPVDFVSPGRKYHFRTYFKVLAPVAAEWQGFIHIDGYRKRHNGDHTITSGHYPMANWLKDDVVVDDHEFTLEPNFTPGSYSIYFGLFVGETRMRVKSGPQDGDNRIVGGPLQVK